MMNVYDAVRTLLAVRSYQDKPIPPESVTRILEAARLTGSSRNRQEWDFIAIRERDTVRRLSELARTGAYIANAPLVVAVVVPDRTTAATDGARAVQDMMLVAWEEGIGSNWVGLANTPEIKALLGVPSELMVLALIPFGYPAQPTGKGRKRRKPLAEIAHAERYGRAYSG